MLSFTRTAVKTIEDRGFRVRGYHDSIDERPAPVVLTATDTSTSKIFKVRREDGDEYGASDLQLVAQEGFSVTTSSKALEFTA